MIPKVIHYCWFGNNPKNDIIQMCIDSWKKYCPDYEILEWNETNFDVNMTDYTRDAYTDKKYAYVSDFARLWIIYKYGGFYLDTDVLLRSSLDELCKYDCWLATEEITYVATGLGFGAKKEHPLILNLLNEYYKRTYPSGTNVVLDTPIVEKHLPKWQKNDSCQVVDGVYITAYKEYSKFARHLYTNLGSVLSEDDEKQRAEMIRERLKRTSTRKERIAWKLRVFVRNPRLINFFSKRKSSIFAKIYYFIAYDLIEYGPMYYLKRIFKK